MMDDKDLYSEVIKKLSVIYVTEDDFVDSNDFSICELLNSRQKISEDICEVKKELIRSAIFDFFAQKGFKAYVFFRTGNRVAIRLKLFDFENNIYVERVKQQFSDIKKHTKVKNENDKVYVVSSEKVSEMIDSLGKLDDISAKKDIVKSAAKQILELSSRDAIFFVGKELLIKVFTPAGEGEDRQAKRYYDSIPPEKLKKFDEFIKKSNMETRINNAIKKAMLNDFDFKRINNFQFGKGFIKTLQTICIDVVSGFVKDDEYVVFGYANYLLRKMFDPILTQLSSALIELILQKNKNAEEFVKFYNGDVAFAPNGSKFKKPDIIDEYGQRWNYSTIFQLSMQRVKIIEKIDEAENAIKKTKSVIEDLDTKITEALSTISDRNEELAKLEENFASLDAEILEKKDSLQKLRTEANKNKDRDKEYELKVSITNASNELKRLTRLEEQNVINKKKIEAEVEKLTIRNNIMDKDKKAYEKKLENDIEKKKLLIENMRPIEEKYGHMLKALSKALSSFRGI